jgi:hypothetical protein
MPSVYSSGDNARATRHAKGCVTSEASMMTVTARGHTTTTEALRNKTMTTGSSTASVSIKALP